MSAVWRLPSRIGLGRRPLMGNPRALHCVRSRLRMTHALSRRKRRMGEKSAV